MKKELKTIAVSALVSASITGSLFCASQLASPAQAHADVITGCQDDLWITLQATRRDICDGAIRPDGSWLRARGFYTPAHYVPLRTNCYGTYSISCTTTGGYYVPFHKADLTSYVVFPDNVLPDEPGHLVNNNPASF